MRQLQLPDKVIGWLDTASVKAEIGRRWEVTGADVVSVISKVATIPEDMVFREVTDRFRDHGRRVSASASSASATRSTQSRAGWC